MAAKLPARIAVRFGWALRRAATTAASSATWAVWRAWIRSGEVHAAATAVDFFIGCVQVKVFNLATIGGFSVRGGSCIFRLSNLCTEKRDCSVAALNFPESLARPKRGFLRFCILPNNQWPRILAAIFEVPELLVGLKSAE